MPELKNLLHSSSLALSQCSNLLSLSDLGDPDDDSLNRTLPDSKTLEEESGWCCIWDRRLRYPILDKTGICVRKNGLGIKILRRNRKKFVQRGSMERSKKALEDHVRVWVENKVASGVPERECCLSFLVNAPRMVECRMCTKIIYPEEEVLCSVRGCQEAYHIICAKQTLGFSSSKSFKCPQHSCFICKRKGYWRCKRCTIAAHSKCAPWPDDVIYPRNQPGRAVCWRHPTDWRLEKEHAVPTSDIEEVFRRLPLPYIEEEFKIDLMWKDIMENKMEPTPYVHIRRNVYLVKKKRDEGDDDVGCTNCNGSICSEDCVCRVQCISCSKACNCSGTCTNRPFRKEKKVKVVKTQFCGWGVVAVESFEKGDFVIEYIGEVIDDALCEQRLWDMKHRGDQNFYMCELRKDFTIDATFKGNTARFLNHSCDPNCKLEKWQVDGETRVGVFASQSIKSGDPLTYDYRFVHFGPKVECFCGASNCRRYLGSKRKTDMVNMCWGSRRKRSKAVAT
ncbi:SET domain group 4 [Tasmannia lanceolata]|uniref:SET domain group 4 n=1 Tax=Tasmannia lanceolata TaxID=3420 RepID=UPI00406466E1